MADVAAEISAKLGINTSDFKAALASADASVKKFGANGAKGADGFGESIKGVNHGMRELKEVLVGGGTVEAVKQFYEVAIKAAEKNKDASNENARAVRAFAKDLDVVSNGFGDLAMTAVGTFNRVGETIGRNIRFAKEFFEASVLGNAQNLAAFDQAEESERKAQEMERSYAEEKRKHGEDYKRINAEIKQVQDSLTESKTKEIEPTQRIKNLAEDRAAIEEKLADGTKLGVERRQLELDLLKNQKAVQEAQLELTKKLQAESIASNKQMFDVALKGMDTQQKLAYLAENIRSTEAIIAQLKKKGFDVTVMEAELADLIAKRSATAGEAEAKRLDNKRKIAGSTQEEEELLSLTAKTLNGIVTGPEAERLKQIRLQRQERAKQIDIDELLQKSVDGKLTPAEEKKLQKLLDQKTALEQQAKIQDVLLANAKSEAAAQSVITDQYHQQVEEASKLNSVSGYHGTVTQMGDLRTLSDVQLEALIRKQQGKLPMMRQEDTMRKSVWDMTNGESVETALVRTNLEAAMTEQRKRSDFRQYVGAFGQRAAETNYAPDEFQRLMQYLSPETQKQQAKDINSIANTLQNVFPAQARNIRG